MKISVHSIAVTLLAALLSATGATAAGPAAPAGPAAVTVTAPWARATVPGQSSSGLYARITSAGGGRLVAVTSPVAGVVELHTMAMDGDVMRMRALPAIELPAGKPVELKPGGVHVMLMDLRRQLKAGESVPVTLVVERPGNRRETVTIQATVRPLAAAGATTH